MEKGGEWREEVEKGGEWREEVEKGGEWAEKGGGRVNEGEGRREETMFYTYSLHSTSYILCNK